MSTRAIVTGASSGIGLEASRQFLEKDWQVMDVSIDADQNNTARL